MNQFKLTVGWMYLIYIILYSIYIGFGITSENNSFIHTYAIFNIIYLCFACFGLLFIWKEWVSLLMLMVLTLENPGMTKYFGIQVNYSNNQMNPVFGLLLIFITRFGNIIWIICGIYALLTGNLLKIEYLYISSILLFRIVYEFKTEKKEQVDQQQTLPN